MVIECLLCATRYSECFTLHSNLLEFVLLLSYLSGKGIKNKSEHRRDMYILKEFMVELILHLFIQ